MSIQCPLLSISILLIAVQGLYQSLQFDESQAENSPFSQWSTRIVCEDAESDPFIVPLHWHKVYLSLSYEALASVRPR